MHLPIEQLANHLQKGVQALYLIIGNEPLAQKESLDAIRQAARHAGVEERTSFNVERYFNWQQLSHFGQSTSLFSTLRLLEIHIPSGKPGVEGSKALQEIAMHKIPDTTVLVILPKLDRESKNSVWFTRLEQQAVQITCDEIPPNALPQWLAKRLAAQGQSADNISLEFIATQVEGNLLAAHQEIEKLALLYPQGKLSHDAIRDSVFNVSRYDAFQLGEAVLMGDMSRTVRILEGLREEGQTAVSVMNPLIWTFRPLVQLKHAEQRGENLNQAMQQARIFGERQNIVRQALVKFSLRQLNATLQKLTEIDKAAKGLLNNDAWLEISRLCFGLAKIVGRSR